MTAGPLALSGRLSLGSLKREHAPREVRKRSQVPALLELVAREQRREPHRLSTARGRFVAEPAVQPGAHRLEFAAVSVDPRDAGLDQQTMVDERAEQLGLIGAGGTNGTHAYTSLAISSSPASTE